MADPTDALVGTILVDKFEIQRQIGEGGMGSIYAARHVVLEKLVAVKVMHAEYTRRGDLVERFLHEAKAAARIRHDNVVDIYDFGKTATGQVFMAMELLEGLDLHDELRQGGPLSWKRAQAIALQMCSALQAAHETGVIHRDMKPENIFLTARLGRKDFVKILDFGIAKLMDLEREGRNLTKAGMVFGTPEYMAPEQARGEKSDARVDVYATGCILYEMLANHAPYRADTFMGVLTRHLFDAVPQVAAIEGRSDIPAGLQLVLERAMAKERGDRFASMNELAVALDALGDAQPATVFIPAAAPAPSPPAVTPTDVVTRPPARRTALYVAAGLAVLAIAGVWVGTRDPAPRPPPAPAAAPPSPAASAPDPAPPPPPTPAAEAVPAPAPAPDPAPPAAAAAAPTARKRPPRAKPAPPVPQARPVPVSSVASPPPTPVKLPSDKPTVDKVKDLKDPFPGQ